MAKQRRHQGTGAVYQRDDGKWCAAVELGHDATGKRRRKVVVARTKADAVAKLKAVQRQLDTTGSVPTGVSTVEAYLTRWLADQAAVRLKPRGLQGYRTTVTQHLIPHIGRHRLDQLTAQHVLALHTALRAQQAARTGRGRLAEASVLKAHAVLSKALTDAVRHGLVPRNVAQLVDRPSRSGDDVDHLDAAQAQMVLRNVATDPLGSRWAFAFLTAARQGECLGLQRHRVDLERGTADISWQLQRLGYAHGCGDTCGKRFAGNCPQKYLEVPPGYTHQVLKGALCLTKPKSGKPRIVPVIPPLARWLGHHMAMTSPGPNDLVWHRGDRPLDPRQDYQAWVDMLTELGLPQVKLHSTRHTAVSLLLMLGAQEAVVRQIAGHSTVAAARAYQHVDQATAAAALDRLGQLLAIEGPG